MLINLRPRLMALLALVAVSGCNHLPSIGALNPFMASSSSRVDPAKVVVVESAATRVIAPGAKLVPEAKAAAYPDTLPDVAAQTVVPEAVPAIVPRPGPEQTVSYTANAVTLGDTQGVMDLPPTYWAVQIAAVKNIERVAAMVKEHHLQGMLGVPMNTEVGPLHAVLTGVFVEREDALASAENLPEVLSGYQPWVRPLAHLQAAMR